MKNNWIDRVVGRVHEDVDVPPEVTANEPERQSREQYDEETGEIPAGGEGVASESMVAELLQAWHSGQRSEVASQILFTPVSYADFAKFCYAIGQQDAVALGVMLDQMSESEGLGPASSHERVLASIHGQGAAPEEEPPAPTSAPATPPVTPTEALPEPPQEPHEVGSQLEPRRR